MKAAVVHAFGESPRFETFADPTPAEGEKLVRVRAAGLHPLVRGLARGSHYGSAGALPMIPGVDGVGELEDGSRVYFGVMRAPYGTMAEIAPAAPGWCMPIPAGVDDATVAAIMNPGMSAWLALKSRARMERGATVLILGATGVAGQLAIQIARALGASRVIAAGRRVAAFPDLRALGADATVDLNGSQEEIVAAIRASAGDAGIQVILDYVWGKPAEAAIAAVTRRGLGHVARRVCLVQVGDGAGSIISLPAAVLRSSALEILGSGAGSVPMDQIIAGFPAFLDHVARGDLKIDVERVKLSDVESAWSTAAEGRRVVFTP